MNDDQGSKDRFFAQLAGISEAMTAAHGKDFAMGALILAARFIAEGEARERAAADAAKAAPAGSVPRSDAMPRPGVPEHDAGNSAIWTPGSGSPRKGERH